MTQNVFCVLALCVGQVPGGAVSPYAQIPNQPVYQQAAPQAGPRVEAVPMTGEGTIYTQYSPPSRGPLRDWFASRFGVRHQQASCGCMNHSAPAAISYTLPAGQPQGNPMPVPVTVHNYGAAMPSGNQTTAAPPLEATEESENRTAQQQQQPEANPSEAPGPLPSKLQVDKKYEGQIGHEQDYSWITGHLFYVHSDGGHWVVRYSLPSEIDKFGGSVILAPGVEMKNFREGDLVTIYGEILNEQPTSPSLSGALYRVNSIQIMERSDP